MKILVSLLFCVTYLFPQEYPDKTVHEYIKKGVFYLGAAEYDKANSTFTQLQKEKPGLPAGLLFQAATEIVKSFDYGIPLNKNLIESKLSEAAKIAQKNYSDNKNDIWNNYFMALAAGYSTYYEYLQQNWLTVLETGVEALRYFDRCIELDPKFYEASSAIAIFNYWKSSSTESLHWLPFFDDKREESLQIINFNLNHFFYNTNLTYTSLIWILIDRKEYQKAIVAADEVLAEFPGNRIVKWGKARALEEIDRREAIRVYKNILENHPKSGNTYLYNEVLLLHKIAMNYEKLGDKKSALEYCNYVLAISGYSEFDKERLKDRLKRVKKLKNDLGKAL